jgi:ubiquinone/menaquinone biosynthesis C-methylase UbiE
MKNQPIPNDVPIEKYQDARTTVQNPLGRLDAELSTDRILTQVVKLATSTLPVQKTTEHLDIGSGTGALISLLWARNPNFRSSACDYTDTLMAIADQRVDICDLNTQALPYDSDTFDLVRCTEVIEHLENYRNVVRETFRVTKPGGLAIFTTPNILNLRSRLRYLSFGFANLFGPLPVGRKERFSTVGHITPISFFYLAHALAESGFEDIDLSIDKMQKSSLWKLPLFYPVIALFGSMESRREVRKYKTIDTSNRRYVAVQNHLRVLLGRTIIVSTRKPDTLPDRTRST